MQMGDIDPCAESTVDEPLEAVDHKSCKVSILHRDAFVGEDHFNCSNKEIVEMDSLMENLQISDEDDLNDLPLEERENLHVKNTICSSISNKKTSQIFPPNASELKDLNNCAAIICTEALQSWPSIVAKAKLSTIELGYESSVAVSNPAEDRLVPYHESSKFVSALKGSRAQQGKPLDPNLHITWASNVYDPPATSSSHTVKGRPRRHHLSKPKAPDRHKQQKHTKAKPSNASSGDRKHSHRRSSGSILDPRMARLQGLARRSSPAGFGPSKIRQAVDIAAASGRESSKCGAETCSQCALQTIDGVRRRSTSHPEERSCIHSED